MTPRLRIFISSPGDVPDERLRADLIIDKLAQDYVRYFSIQSYRWEHEPMLASGHFQDAIEPPSAADVVILILWTRLGTSLPERTAVREYRGLDGRAPVTGTEWEFEDALAAARQRGAPDILVFRNGSPAAIDSRNAEARAKSLEQLEALDVFWRRHFADRGVFLAGASEYRDIEEFAIRLEESLRKLIERRIKSQTAGAGSEDNAPAWLGNPFRGLQSYEFEHSDIFFGRDTYVAKAAEQLSSRARAGNAFLLVVGPSGSGKSSLVKAALVPRLMKPQRMEGIAILRRAVFRPSDGRSDLFLGLAETLVQGSPREGVGLPELLAPGQTAKDFADYLRANVGSPGFAFTSALGRVTEAARTSKRILPHEVAKLIIVIDQLEELFTIAEISQDERVAFIQLLKCLAHSGAVFVVATIRADFWHHVLEIPDLLTLSEGTGRLDVAVPSHAEIAEIIRKPAQAAGLRFAVHPETGLGLDTVLAEHASSEPGVLPLLSFTLDALYRTDVEQSGGQELTFSGYDQLGGLEGAIAKRADEVLTSLPPKVQASAPRVLRALATLGGVGGDTPVARIVPLSNFPPTTDLRAVVDAFVAARLLVASSESQTATVRVAHESLISRWKRAHEQLTSDRRDLETRSLIERQYMRWRQASESTRHQLLLRDPDLANALDLASRWGDEISDDLRAFIEQSHKQQKRRQQMAIAASIVFALLAVAATVFGVFAYRAEQQAQLARARATKAEGVAVTERDQAVQQRNAALVSQSRYLASEADTLVRDGQIRSAIALLRVALPDLEGANKRPLVADAIAGAYHALYANREIGRVDVPGDATAIIGIPESQTLIIATPKQLLIRNARGSGSDRVLAHEFGAVARLAIDGRGERLLMIAPSGTVAVRELKADRELLKVQGDGPGAHAYLLNNGNRLLVVGSDGKLWRLIDVTSGKEVAKRELTGSIATLVDPARNILMAVAGERIHRLSSDDLSDQSTADIEKAAEVALVLSPDGKLVYAVITPDILTGRIAVLDAQTLEQQRSFGRIVGGARHAAIAPNAKMLAIHGLIGIDFFDIERGERLYHMTTNRDARRGLFLGQSGSDYVAYGTNGFIRRYAPSIGVEMAAYRMTGGAAVEQIMELPDRSGFTAISDRPAATIWSYDAQTLSRQHTVPLIVNGLDMRMPSMIEAFSIVPGRDEALASYVDHSVRRWSLPSGEARLIRAAAPKAEGAEHVASLSGGISLIAGASGKLIVFTDESGSERPAGELNLPPLKYLGDLGERRAFAVTKAGAAFVLDLTSVSQPQQRALPELKNCVRQVTVPGRALCIDENDTVRVWDGRGQRLLLERSPPASAKLLTGFMSEDGALFAVGYSNGEVVTQSTLDDTVRFQGTVTARLAGDMLRVAMERGWLSAADRTKVQQGAESLETAIGPISIAISPDAKWLALTALDRTIKLVNLETGEINNTLTTPRGISQNIAFSPNSTLLAAIESSDYSALNVYQIPDGQRLVSISLANQPTSRLKALGTGQGFATIDTGGRIVVHPIFQDWQDLVKFLATQYPDELTPRQRRAFFVE